MKRLQNTPPEEDGPSLSDIVRWTQALMDLHKRIAPHFARPEPREHARLYLQAVLSDIPRKNGWQVAEHARQERPYGMQRLLSTAVWDADRVRDELRSAVLDALGRGDQGQGAPADANAIYPVMGVDETAFPKRGKCSAGVQKQHCGTTGRVENCQVAVFLNSVTARGHALIDRELYLPQEWLGDPQRCQKAGIPETVALRTKGELAKRMIERARDAHLPIRWVVGDTVYGHGRDLRTWLEEQGYSHALAVPCIEVACVGTPEDCLLADVATIAQQRLPEQDWQRLSMSQGTKGPRAFDWAILPLLHRGEVDGRHWLVIRRCLDDPKGCTLQTMVSAIGARCKIEEDFEKTKEIGLDHYEVRSYVGWYRHVTLVLLAYAFLVGICVQEESGSFERDKDLQAQKPSSPESAGSHAKPSDPLQESSHLSAHCELEDTFPSPPLIPLTTAEVRHLLARLIWPAPTSVPLGRAWSHFRRSHQSWASFSHTKRRLKAG